MALRKFVPDPELFDPTDDQSWIGDWHHDDGSSLYGQGDPEMGRELLAENDPAPADDGPPAWGGPLNDEAAAGVLDAGKPLAPKGALAPPAPAPAGGWEDDVPPEVANVLHQQAGEAGLDPGKLAAVIKHESGWNPSVGSQGDAGKDAHAGLIQFSRNLWPGVAAAAGQPNVTWEEMRNMSAADQIPFVVAYYKGKGLTPESGEGDYRLATYKPAHLKEGDDFVLDDASSSKGVKATPQNQRLDLNQDGVINSYEQNAGLDSNKDGKVTAGEVRGGKSGVPGNQPGIRQPAANLATTPLGSQPGMPSQMGGLPTAQVSVQGTPLTPDQIAQQQQAVGQRYAVQAGAHQQAEALRTEGRNEVMQMWEKHYADQQTNATAETQRQQKIATEAQTKIDREVNAPIQKIDPRRYIKEMSTGSKVLGAIGILFGAIGQAANSMIGINSPNLALQMLNSAIDSDIDAQKGEIARGEQQASNRVAHWTKILGNAESAVNATRAESKIAAAGIMQARATSAGASKEQQAAGLEHAANLFSQGQAEIASITQRENERLQTVYKAPPPPKAGSPDALVKAIQAAKEARQELKLSGVPDDQIDGILKSQGLPLLTGETVPQNQARAKAEGAADEDTSKELEPIAVAEAGWRKTLQSLDSIAKRGLSSEKYSEPEEMVGSDWFPGSPTNAEVKSFKQNLGETINASIRAEKGNQTPEDIERIRQAVVGGGTIEDIRRGIQSQLERLKLQRQYVSGRRGGSAQRVGAGVAAEDMPAVSGKVYVPGQGPRR